MEKIYNTMTEPEQESKKTITINLETWQELMKIKIERNFRSLDEAIKWLIQNLQKQ